MIRNLFKYSLMLGIIFSFVTCDKVIYDEQDNSDASREAIFLSVTRDKTAKFRSSPDLPEDSTINEDDIDWEDRVNSLALLVFDSDGNKIAEHINDAGSGAADEDFVIKLYPGNLDFYFVANMPAMAATLSSIIDVDDMIDYMRNLYDLSVEHYVGAKEANGFPMSRVYKNQNITKGGTVYQPAPFRPKNDDGLTEDKILLVRVVAKLEVKVPATENQFVGNITLKNAFSKFHLQHGDVRTETVDGKNSSVAQSTKTPHTSISHFGDVVLNEFLPADGYVTYTAYMPEALMNEAKWSNADHKPINYFVIKTTSGVDFEIPIITANNMDWNDNYLAYAKNDTDLDKYNIYRNRRYFYEVRNLSDIEIQYNVKEWTKVERQLFMGYGYNVIIDENGEITIENTIDDCMPHHVRLEAQGGAYFGEPSITTIEYGYKDDENPTEAEMKAGYKETFTGKDLNNSNVAAGAEYLKIYYNNILVKTYTK